MLCPSGDKASIHRNVVELLKFVLFVVEGLASAVSLFAGSSAFKGIFMIHGVHELVSRVVVVVAT